MISEDTGKKALVERRAGEGSPRPRLGISACLLGQCVRYDGQHKFDGFLVNTLGKFVEYVPVCPEVECGFGVPRNPMHLVGSTDAPRLVVQKTGVDLTEPMLAWAECRVKDLEKENLCGYVFKSKSPSCGVSRVKLYNQRGALTGSSQGVFASVFTRHFPRLPVEEEGRLHDPLLCHNFIERVTTLRRFCTAVAQGPEGLVVFHTRQKLLLMSHSSGLTRDLGRIVADAGKRDFAEIKREYEDLLVKTLSLKITPAKQANVLQHILGFFKKLITSEEKHEILNAIARYRSGDITLAALLLLLKYLAGKYGVEWLLEQIYLDPYRLELRICGCLSSPATDDA